MKPRDLRDLVHFSDDEPRHETLFETEHLWSEVICLQGAQGLGPMTDPASDAVLCVLSGEIATQVDKSRARAFGIDARPAGIRATVKNASEHPCGGAGQIAAPSSDARRSPRVTRRNYRSGPIAMMCCRSERCARPINARITGRYARAASSPSTGTSQTDVFDQRNPVPPSIGTIPHPGAGDEAAVTDHESPRRLPHRHLHRLGERGDAEGRVFTARRTPTPSRDRRPPRPGRHRASSRPVAPSVDQHRPRHGASSAARSRARHACVECRDAGIAPAAEPDAARLRT